MNRILTKTVIAILAVTMMVGGIIFYACQKESESKMGTETTVTEGGKQKDIVGHIIIATVESKKHGVGNGKDKYCSSGGYGCWLWFRNGMLDENTLSNGKIPIAFVSLINNEGDTDENSNGNSNGSRNIVLDFRYADNMASSLAELFVLDEGLLIIEEDIVEEGDSPLLEIIGVTANVSQCRIPAGSYPITVCDEGIKVTLPILY